MRGYTETIAPAKAKELLEHVKAVVAPMTTLAPGREGERDGSQFTTCHEVVKAVAAAVPGLTPVRGWFRRRGIEHSWLVVDFYPDWVIDAYPIAVVGPPLLVDTLFPSPWANCYLARVGCEWRW